MKVFISWSGERSKFVAEALRNWIPKVLQIIKPWMSDEDISTGARWATHIANELEHTTVGICCLTPENQHSPWVMFEAGALSKTIAHSYVCPYLIGMETSQLTGPMSQFQSVNANKEGTLRILHTLNKAAGLILQDKELDDIFDVWWPRLEQNINSIPKISDEKIAHRSTEEILDEIVKNTREQLRREEIRLTYFQKREKESDKLLESLEQMKGLLLGSANYLKFIANRSQIQPTKKNPKQSKSTAKHLQTFQDSAKGIEFSLPDMLNTLKQLSETSKLEIRKLLEDSNADQLPDSVV